MCFFCVNKITCGIAHGKASARPKETECNINDRGNLATLNDCVVCKEIAAKDNPSKQICKLRAMRLIAKTGKGCITCEDHVCKNYWDLREHEHKWQRQCTTESSETNETIME